MAEAPAVSVVIPTHDRREALRRALESFANQTAAPGTYEVVVSLDACGDGSREMLEAFEAPFELRWVVPAGRGRAAACNAAVAAARGGVLIVLDDDMTVVPEFVERHRAHHPPGSRTCVLGAVPVELRPDSPRAARYVKEKFDLHLSRLGDRRHLELPRSFYTGNASLRTEVMREVGGFNEAFGVYGNEDVELSLRLRAAGVRLEYDPDALARQEYGKDLVGLQRDTEEKGRTTVLLARAHPEVFGDLRLAAPDESGRPWLAARAVLLWATRRLPATAPVVFACAALLERLGLWRAPLFYRATLDYAFWAGVDASLAESEERGELASLAAQLRRGPIDLLLHR
ncbi:MAG TPA: glycosyltransferase [Solirubrobacterales bacterium]|jgi:GT2 family glycosyltransferase|nr:glycosyltransferase [Solirubrobacterales bacterium]